MTEIHRAYSLALSRRSSLLKRHRKAANNLARSGRSLCLHGFESVIKHARVSINMSMGKLVRFLEHGEWLNIYEAVAVMTGSSGVERDRIVRSRLHRFDEARMSIETFLGFSSDVHYGALNLGGAGDYSKHGVCCVVFPLKGSWSHVTCFLGDSIRSCFPRASGKILDEEEILKRFGIGKDFWRFAIIDSESFLSCSCECIDPAEIRDIYESTAMAVEFHLHGKVTAAEVIEVRIPRSWYRMILHLEKRYGTTTESPVEEADTVRHFQLIKKELTKRRIPLLIGE